MSHPPRTFTCRGPRIAFPGGELGWTDPHTGKPSSRDFPAMEPAAVDAQLLQLLNPKVKGFDKGAAAALDIATRRCGADLTALIDAGTHIRKEKDGKRINRCPSCQNEYGFYPAVGKPTAKPAPRAKGRPR